MTATGIPAGIRSAALVVINPSGNRTRVLLQPVPFTIGRQADNHLVLRDNRASRKHAQIVAENGTYWIEDLGSRHGVWVNGKRITRHALSTGDNIEFGVQDSYRLQFTAEEDEIKRLLDQFSAPAKEAATGNLSKLRALVEVARALQSSLSMTDVLTAVVDAALAVTGAERGFLLLRQGDDLQVRVGRNRSRATLSKDDLRVPTQIINRSLRQRRDLLTMTFDPREMRADRSTESVSDLELMSVVCVPLVSVRASTNEETMMVSSGTNSIGLLYMDSRQGTADLSSGNRELLQTLALEASTILENARLLEEERAKHRLEEELNIAREIQASLLPRRLPSTGWFRAAGSSIPSFEVGGDYFDVRQVSDSMWAAVIADVSGKGVSSALLAALLQGAFLLASESGRPMEHSVERINKYLNERTQGEKYATLFFCMVSDRGEMRYVNAGHASPLLFRRNGRIETLAPTGMPCGLLEVATFSTEHTTLNPGDKIVAFSDGFSEAQNQLGEFFDAKKIREALRQNADLDCAALHTALMEVLEAFTEGQAQNDDLTLVILEYSGRGDTQPRV